MIEIWNKYFFLLINQYADRNIWLDNLAIYLAEYTPYFFIIILLILWFQKKGDYKIPVLLSGYSVLLALFSSWVIGLFYFHNRPFADGLGTNLIYHFADSSFPSDHTIFSIAIASQFLWWKSLRKFGISLLFLVALSGLARIFIGVHYPFDISGSVIIGSISSFIIYFFTGKLNTINQFILRIDSLIFNRK
jgi:undecaprenyl-diphosphatase